MYHYIIAIVNLLSILFLLDLLFYRKSIRMAELNSFQNFFYFLHVQQIGTIKHIYMPFSTKVVYIPKQSMHSLRGRRDNSNGKDIMLSRRQRISLSLLKNKINPL